MHGLKPAFYLLCLGSNAAAKLHHLYVGSFNASAIHNVAFDDETLTLSLVRSFPTSDPHYWIDFDVRLLFFFLGILYADSNSMRKRTSTLPPCQNGQAIRSLMI